MSEKGFWFWFWHPLDFYVLQTRTRCDGVAHEKHLRAMYKKFEILLQVED